MPTTSDDDFARARCAVCEYSRPTTWNGGAVLACHRHAPMPMGASWSSGEYDPAAAWPHVDDEDWCGEYRWRGPIRSS